MGWGGVGVKTSLRIVAAVRRPSTWTQVLNNFFLYLYIPPHQWWVPGSTLTVPPPPSLAMGPCQ